MRRKVRLHLSEVRVSGWPARPKRSSRCAFAVVESALVLLWRDKARDGKSAGISKVVGRKFANSARSANRASHRQRRNCRRKGRSSIVNRKERSAMTTRRNWCLCTLPARFHPSHPSFVTLILSSSRMSIGCSRCSPVARTTRVDASASRIAMQNDAAGSSAFSILRASIVLALRACRISIHANPTPRLPPSPSSCVSAAQIVRVIGIVSLSNKRPIFWKAATVQSEKSRDRGDA